MGMVFIDGMIMLVAAVRNCRMLLNRVLEICNLLLNHPAFNSYKFGNKQLKLLNIESKISNCP